MEILKIEKYPRVRGLFKELDFNVQVPSILDGNSRGSVTVDNALTPKAGLIWDHLATIYLAGSDLDPELNRSLSQWVTKTVAPQARAFGISDLTLVYEPDSWKNRLPEIFSGYDLELASRRYHTFQHPEAILENPLSAGFGLQPINHALLAQTGLVNLDWVKSWISSFWQTEQGFIEKGVGYCALHQDRIIASLCLSVFVSGNRVEFGTATQPEFQSRGLSTLVARACLKDCLGQGRTPIWQCWADNLPSIAVARKAGFELERQYTVFKLKL